MHSHSDPIFQFQSVYCSKRQLISGCAWVRYDVAHDALEHAVFHGAGAGCHHSLQLLLRVLASCEDAEDEEGNGD